MTSSIGPMSDDTRATIDDTRREQLGAALRRASQASGRGAAADASPRRTHASGAIDRSAVAYRVFSKLLATEGLRAALYSLLRLTDYRFISIFRFRDGRATSVVHVDRENLTLQQADEVQDTATYCCHVRDANGPFVTADAVVDPRTQDHPARDAVRAYCGMPIVDAAGELIGTLCHYDLVPRDPEQLEVDLLVRVAGALSAPGLVPPYPARP